MLPLTLRLINMTRITFEDIWPCHFDLLALSHERVVGTLKHSDVEIVEIFNFGPKCWIDGHFHYKRLEKVM